MELSVREAAALMGRSRRTVRAQVARGDLPGVKRNGRWHIRRDHLPLTEAQRAILQGKARSLRSAVESVLPSRLAPTAGRRHRSIVDLDAFRLGSELLREIRSNADEQLPGGTREQAAAYLEDALLSIAEAVQQFDREVKLAALRQARSALARATATMLLACGDPPPEPVFSWVTALEADVIPAVGGFARWADNLRTPRS